MNNLSVKILRVIGYLLWGVFVNALAVWLIGPLVQDLAVYGVLAVAAIVLVWLTSIYPRARRPWISFTLFSLLLGQGLSALAFSSFAKTIVVTVVMALGLFIIAMWFGRVRFVPLFFGTVGIIVANAVLPFSDWPFLTQFKVVEQSRLHINPHDLDDAPFSVIHTPTGDALITVNGFVPSTELLQQLVGQATDTPDALQNVLQTASGEYQFVEFKDVNGHLERTTPSPQDLAKANPLQLIPSIFPFQLAHWYVVNGQVDEYLSPNLPSNQAVEAGMDPAAYASTMEAVSNQAVQVELTDWRNALSQLGVQPQQSGWYIQSGHLNGTYNGKSVSIPVNATSVVGQGHFTSVGANEVLLVGNNDLQVVDLDKQQVISTYRGTSQNPVPNDVMCGPLTRGGTDAVFINASPAYILTVDGTGSWKTVYTATSPTFRFETVLSDAGTPQIVTNDPSAVRNAPTRYFSAYHFVPSANGHSGQLQRDWRVFRTNVVNVTPITLSNGGAHQLAVSIYGTGEFLVLQKYNLPVLPIALIVLGVVIVGGWVVRIRAKKEGDRS
ncbi:hypothetical protein [Alicyclobacillus dauci]|uniref:Uncharacterized protein n=1 Tax=Alicyclobacillus dauci TaxID=1475485 RepID=A0ABY6YY06_9BACL|nr:hypothetical protein [Alicyclobacillus dauci]WAH35446.1 hypothetical protein NZD86_14185 [Alicyclobacillus dauci]